jgi:hypothetical protein
MATQHNPDQPGMAAEPAPAAAKWAPARKATVPSALVRRMKA